MADQDHCDAAVLPSLEDPLAPAVEAGTTAAGDGPKTAYQAAMDEGERLLRRPRLLPLLSRRNPPPNPPHSIRAQ